MKTFAAIDVGSFETSMKIFEFSGKNSIRIIEHVRQRIDLGTDTYTKGKIGHDKLDELCRTLKEFTDIMKTYKVCDYEAYGTSAIRETENMLILLDQIVQRTGIKLGVLSNSEQQFIDYKSIAFKGDTFENLIQEGTAIVDIGGGSIQISLFDKGTLIATQNLRMGVLRILEHLHHLNAKSGQIKNLVEEMITPQLTTFKKMYLKEKEIKTIIIVDDYLSVLVAGKEKLSGSNPIKSIQNYEYFLQIMQKKSYQEIAKTLQIADEKVPLMYISALLVKYTSNILGAENIWAPGVTLCDGIGYKYAEQNKMIAVQHDFEKDIVTCALNISKRYIGSKKRGETIENIAITIFDSMKKIHGLGKRERLYLRIAALLHDCGKYISMVNVGENSYNIIMATEIIGLSHAEREIVANVVRYNHTPFVYYNKMKTMNYSFTTQSYLIVSKLTAILNISNGLDRSQKQKFKGIKAKLQEEQLLLIVETLEDITLEKGLLEEKSKFFKEVFSIQPMIKQKKLI